MEKGGRTCRAAAILVTLFALLVGAGAFGQSQEYKPIRAPMMPGVRKLADFVKARLAQIGATEAGGDMLLASDLASESLSGASNYATALGNGRLSVELSPWADLVVVRWPTITYSDQLRYFTSVSSLLAAKPKPIRYNLDAPSADWRRYGHPVEPCPELGSRGGLQLGSGQVVWLGDPSWTSERGFTPEDATVLTTRLTRPEVKVAVTDWVDPQADFMVRSFQIQGQAKRFFYHSTFAPFMAHQGQYTASDPKEAGFAAVYSETDRVVIHFQPKVQDRDRMKRLPASDIKPADIDGVYPEGGVFVVWGFAEKADGFQVGADRCRRAVSSDAPQGGRADANDGKLSGNRVFLGPVDAALSREISPGQENTVSVIIALADSAQKAVKIIQDVRAAGVSEEREQAVAAGQAVSKRIHLPPTNDAVTDRVIRRSVLNLLQAQDREAGAIVASISRQPHYHFDWPRDGAFFDLTLDLAGFPEAVSRHNAFYIGTQFTKKMAFGPVWIFNYRLPWYNPSGHWPSNIAVDGFHGSMPSLMPFEIDETGLSVWDFWRHERTLPEGERAAYIARMKGTFELAAQALMRFIDVKRGWVRPGLEDDNFPPDATLHGAASVLAGIAGACDAGPRWGFPAAETREWCAAAKSLRDGIRGRTTFPVMLDQAGFRGLAWTLWPAPVFDDFSEPGAVAIKERLAASIRDKVAKERGFAYLGEEVFTLALADQEGKYRDLCIRALNLLTHEVAFPGADCYGEVTLWGDFAGPGQKVAQQRTSIPHLWNGVTVYLAAVALYEPERFAPMRPPTPK